MTETEKIRIVYANMYRYAFYCERVLAWEESVLNNRTMSDGEYIRGSGFRPDPTARGAIRLAEPPPQIVAAQAWIKVIDEAYEMMLIDDAAYGRRKNRGIAYVMCEYFCLHSEPRKKSDNAGMRRALARRCKVTERTVYMWLHRITEVTCRLADRNKIFEEDDVNGFGRYDYLHKQR